MTNEELILEKLSKIEDELMEIRESRLAINELKEDLNPLVKQGFYILLRELGEVESGFQLEDSIDLIKRFLRNIGNLAYALEQLENIIELWHTMEPLAKSMVHTGIRSLGELEQRGVFRTYAAMMDVRAKVAAHYGPDDIAAMGDSFVALIGLLKKMSDPKMLELLDKLTDLPAGLDLTKAEPVGPLGMVKALGDPDLKRGIGVALELAKGLGKLSEAAPR